MKEILWQLQMYVLDLEMYKFIMEWLIKLGLL
jgi:hypothetical protein